MSTGAAPEIKEITMDVGGSGDVQMGGSKTRRRRVGRRRHTRTANECDQVGGGVGADVSVEKDTGSTLPSSGTTPQPVAAPTQTGGGAKHKTPVKAPSTIVPATVVSPKVVLAPPKKKPAKLLFVPKHKVIPGHRIAAAKTFKARRVSVTIDNTAKTQKRRTQTLQRVEGMSDDQLRAAAVAAKLSRRETVAKVPSDLLRQMLKDYYMMRGMLV